MTDVAKDRTADQTGYRLVAGDEGQEAVPTWPPHIDQQTCFWCASIAGFVAVGNLCADHVGRVCQTATSEGMPRYRSVGPGSDTSNATRKRRWWRS